MIPKIIHFVWVGNNPKPQSVLNCIESWKKYCPDYDIMEWNDNILKDIDNLYAKQAYENKKWAFVSDYVRLWVLYKYGGFYFDTDLELTNNIDKFRNYDYVTGFEKYKESFHPLTAVWGCEKGNKLIGRLLEEYNYINFISNGNIDQTTNVQRVERFLREKLNFKCEWNGLDTILIEENSFIFPYYYFCLPMLDKENYAIHHYEGSWLDGWSRKIICSIGTYRFIRFRKRKNVLSNNFTILKEESVLRTIDINFFRMKIKICLVKVV